MKRLKSKRRRIKKETSKVYQKLTLQKMLTLNLQRLIPAFSFTFQVKSFQTSLQRNIKLFKQPTRLTRVSFRAKLVVITTIKGAHRQLT